VARFTAGTFHQIDKFMKRIRIIVIVLVLGIAAFAAWKLTGTKKPAAAGEHAEEKEHGHVDEHGAKGRVELNGEELKNSGIAIEEAGAVKLKTKLRLFGKINPNEERLAHVMPRYPGVVKRVNKRLGEQVGKDELLAVVQSNESLQEYDIQSPIAGTVAEKHVVLGEFVATDQKIYTVADLSSVWVDLNVYRQDFPKLRVGQKVIIEAPGVEGKIEGVISYISPFGAESTQTMLARAEIKNEDGMFRPGLFVSADAVLDEQEVDVAVKESALQTVEGNEVIFVQEGDSFEARPVKFGRRDGEWIEVLSGVLPGEKYAAQNSFILKAEIGKGEASHEH
jgi:cobalt-zinc-cadmium efflux system membrane fusion protein